MSLPASSTPDDDARADVGAPAQPRYWALVPCAGVGERAGSALPKQYASVAGQALVRHTLRALRARFPNIAGPKKGRGKSLGPRPKKADTQAPQEDNVEE